MLPETVREAARRFGETPALVDGEGRPWSYTELDRHSDTLAAALARAGVRTGDVVVLRLPSHPWYAVAYVAAAKLGAVTAGVNPLLTPAEQEQLVALVEPRVVISSLGEVEALVRSGTDRRRSPPDPPDLPPDPDRAVAIVFTSGTTGVPKGAVFTNRQLLAAAEMETGGTWGGGGHSYSPTPCSHVGFMARFPWQLRLGGTLHLLERFRPEEALRLIEAYRMPSVSGVPAQVALMLRHPDFDRRDLSSVRGIVLGGGPAPASLRREAARRFGAPVSVRFSCTESGGVGTGTGPDAPEEEALHTVGRPRGPVKLAIRDHEGRAVPPGEVGEVCLRSPTCMAGYWRDPEATARAFWPDRFLRTGDLGWIDEGGCLHLAGRAKEMYVRGGYNVYPQEVEAVLSAHPELAAVAVVPRPDPVMGEVGVAFVVPRDPAAAPTLEELRAFARTRLAPYKLPEDMRVVDALPLTPFQKVDRRALEQSL